MDGKATQLLIDVTDLDSSLSIASDGLLIDCEAKLGQIGEGSLDIVATEPDVSVLSQVELGKYFNEGAHESSGSTVFGRHS